MINVIPTALFPFHLEQIHLCSLCAILLQCRVVVKHLQRKLLIDRLLDLLLLDRVKAVQEQMVQCCVSAVSDKARGVCCAVSLGGTCSVSREERKENQIDDTSGGVQELEWFQ